MKSPKLVESLVSEIKRIAEKLNVNPVVLTKSQVLAELKGYGEWDLRKVGGLASLQKSFFPQTDKDLIAVEYAKQRTSYVSKLERQVGQLDLFHQRTVERLGEIVANSKMEARPLDKKATQAYIKSLRSKSPKGQKRSVCTVWSDQHFGTNFSKEETNGLNEFSWMTAARRLGMLCEQIATYKIEKRHLHEELVIFLLGDNIAGVIHDQEGTHNDYLELQIHGATSYYYQAIEYLKAFYPKIRVLCQPGNHGRAMHKLSKDRAMQKKFDSYENAIFTALSLKFNNDPQVFIEASKAPLIDTEIQGHRVFATHGDTVFSVGNPGETISLGRIAKQVHERNSAIPAGEKHYEMFITGHVHHPVYTHVGKGVRIIINGCLIGTDPYAMSVGIANSQPAQALWETTQKYAQGDTRSIYVNDADEDQKYEQIIKPYKLEIVFDKIV